MSNEAKTKVRSFLRTIYTKIIAILNATRKTAGTAETPAFIDIQIKVVILLLVNISIPCKFSFTQNPSDLDFDLPGTLEVKSDDVIGLAIYCFLLRINSNIGPNSASLRDIRH